MGSSFRAGKTDWEGGEANAKEAVHALVYNLIVYYPVIPDPLLAFS